MARTQKTKARHVKRRSTFRSRGERGSELDRNAAWIARSERQRPPRNQSSTFTPFLGSALASIGALLSIGPRRRMRG